MRRDILRTRFYDELTKEEQKKYFHTKQHNYLPSIDNIYYNVYIENDHKNNLLIQPLIDYLGELKEIAKETRELQKVTNTLSLDLKGVRNYNYCLTNPDLYDIFISSNLLNNQTPRIHVQLRAFGLWTHSPDDMLLSSYNAVKELFDLIQDRYNPIRFSHVMENRIDYCYHTNAVHNPEKTFTEHKLNDEMVTNFRKWQKIGRIESEKGQTTLKNDYIALGDRSSNNIYARIYNKALEVIQENYKSFFWEMWYNHKLISFYDKYCYEYAYKEKNYNAVHKGKIKFYTEYGKNQALKDTYKKLLKNPGATYETYRNFARQHMPELTTVLNVEFETQRKFYYYSDDFIDHELTCIPRFGDPSLNRIYRIIDNKALFIDYLTSKTLSFRKKDGNYKTWWNRLRQTKLGGVKTDLELLRDYSRELDENIVKTRFMNALATCAVYGDRLVTDFKDDALDLLANINDNDKNKIEEYMYKKFHKNNRLKNRKKKIKKPQMNAVNS